VSDATPPRLNPDRLRWIDYWIGVPICFALTLWARLTGRSAGRAAGARPESVLFIELAEMGSTVLACPAVHRLRTRYPDAKIFFLLFKHIDVSVKVLNLIPDDHVFTIDITSPATIVRDTWKFMGDARRVGIDTAINLEMFARFSTILTFLSGAGTRVGFHPFTQKGLYIGDLFTHRVAYNPHIHTWQSLMALVQALDAAPDELPMGKFPAIGREDCVVPRVQTDESARQRIASLLTPAVAGKRLIAINPNASKLISIRKWPLESYAKLVARLLEDPRNACVITGLPSEMEDAQFILDRVPSDRLVSVCGKTTLKELIDLFNVADILVTNDSGPAHFAALTSIHVVVFFGPETPELYRPITERHTVMYSEYACSPCVSAYNQRRSPCGNNRCLQAITVEQAHATIAGILAAQGAA
jgi:ADP-heptose:LPS heptosyltransferase